MDVRSSEIMKRTLYFFGAAKAVTTRKKNVRMVGHFLFTCPLLIIHRRTQALNKMISGVMLARGASFLMPVFEFINVNKLSMKQMAFEENIEVVTRKILIISELEMALPVEFEPTTNGLGNHCSIQLSYGSTRATTAV